MKTLKFILLSVTSILLTVSCNNNDDNIEDLSSEKQFESYWFRYMDYPGSTLATGDQTIRIKYDSHGNPVKRIGGVFPIPFQTGFSFAFSQEVYDELILEIIM
ncbi:hypothetical protein [Chryseobacterium tongliaoense]|uniref:hypothetical protein n=1 Tax=Chryseobacterium tongliaoense TaxID=3240933 RepID=UPI003518C40C